MDIKKIIIPGPAQAILIGVLELPQESTLHEMVVEIERLKTVGRGYVPAEKGIVPAKAKRRSRKQEHVNSEQQESDEDAEA